MPLPTNDVALVERIRDAAQAISGELSKKIVGQKEVIDTLLASFLCGGHALLIGVPGLAKTMLVHSLAEALHLDFNRIQFTPDLMPSDITGSEILHEEKSTGVREFRFVKGPLFANIVLADEINRTPPKTQSALLQAMQEHAVTSSGITFALPNPFWVLATQNPIEQEGTYPLPEAQLDRFMFSIEIDYPSFDDEVLIVKNSHGSAGVPIKPIATAEQLLAYREAIRRIPVADSVVSYAVKIVRHTRPLEAECPTEIKQFLAWGAGPRASQCIIAAAQAFAVLDGRFTPDVEDVRRAVYPVLSHRLVRSFSAETEGVETTEIIKRIIEIVKS